MHEYHKNNNRVISRCKEAITMMGNYQVIISVWWWWWWPATPDVQHKQRPYYSYIALYNALLLCLNEYLFISMQRRIWIWARSKCENCFAFDYYYYYLGAYKDFLRLGRDFDTICLILTRPTTTTVYRVYFSGDWWLYWLMN